MSEARVTLDVATVNNSTTELDKGSIHTDQAIIVIPGYNAPPLPSDSQSHSPSPWRPQFGDTGNVSGNPSSSPSPWSWSPSYAGSDGSPFIIAPIAPAMPAKVIIPTLTTGKPAEQTDQTVYDSNSPIASIVNRNANSVVEVIAHSPQQPANQDYVGSGFFVDNHGDVATAYHIVNGASMVQVRTADGTVLPARIVKTDPKTDLAELSIGSNYMTQPAQLADSTNSLGKGESMLALGHPRGWNNLYVSPGKYNNKVALGDISEPSDLNGADPKLAMLATDMNTQQGDSGAPVFDPNGKVVGVVDRGDKGDHGFMVPVDAVHAFLNGTPNTAVMEPTGTGPYVPHSIFTSRSDGDTLVYGLSGAAILGSKLFSRNLSTTLGARGQMVAGVWGAKDLIFNDASTLVNSLSSGNSGQMLRSGISVGADALMIAGAAGRFVPQLRAASFGLSLAGTAMKLGNNIIGK